MTEKTDTTDEFTSWKDVAYSNMVQNEALLRLLIQKGFITAEEFKEESQAVHRIMQEQMDEEDV
jgi:hypothetical protein